MYRQAAKADSSTESVARLPRVSRLVCRHRWSIAFNSGVATGNQRISIANSSAQSRLSGAVCWEARSSKEYQVPAPPVRPDHAQEVLMLVLRPSLGDHPRHIPGADVNRPVEDPLGPVARDRHAHLLADVAVAGVERRRLRDDRLVEHQHDGADAALQPAF